MASPSRRLIGLIALTAAVALAAASAPAGACTARRLQRVPARPSTESFAPVPGGPSCLSTVPVPAVRTPAVLTAAHQPAVLVAGDSFSFTPPAVPAEPAHPVLAPPSLRSANKLVLRI